MNRLIVDGVEVDPLLLAAEGDPEPVDHQGAAVGDGDASPDARGAQVLPALQHLEQDALALLVQLEQGDQLLQDPVLVLALEIEGDHIFIEEFAQRHCMYLLVLASEPGKLSTR